MRPRNHFLSKKEQILAKARQSRYPYEVLIRKFNSEIGDNNKLLIDIFLWTKENFNYRYKTESGIIIDPIKFKGESSTFFYFSFRNVEDATIFKLTWS